MLREWITRTLRPRSWLADTRIFVVNLPRREDRRRLILDRLGPIGARRVEFIAAIDARQYSIRTTRRLDALRCAGNEVGEIDPGWVAHHMTMATTFDWLTRLKLTEPILLLEDDCVFASDFAARFADAVAVLPADWGCLLAGIWDTDPDRAQAIGPLLRRPGRAVLRHCLYLAPRALPIIAEDLRCFRDTYDNQTAALFSAPCGFGVYATVANLVWQDPGLGSDGVTLSVALDTYHPRE